MHTMAFTWHTTFQYVEKERRREKPTTTTATTTSVQVLFVYGQMSTGAEYEHCNFDIDSHNFFFCTYIYIL